VKGNGTIQISQRRAGGTSDVLPGLVLLGRIPRRECGKRGAAPFVGEHEVFDLLDHDTLFGLTKANGVSGTPSLSRTSSGERFAPWRRLSL
jgi:hypothetical protein